MAMPADQMALLRDFLLRGEAAVTVNGVSGIASVSGNFLISSQTAGADHVRVSNFALFGNVTQRDVVDSIIPDGLRAQFTNSVIDNVWVEHTFSGLKTDLNSNAVLISNSRVCNTFADGIDFYGSTSNSSITNSTSRSTGDDGFAMWSQGATLAGTSQSNSIANSAAALQWYGNGFAVYGGNQMSITNSRASDILNYPCLQMSTQFVSAALPSSASMSARSSAVSTMAAAAALARTCTASDALGMEITPGRRNDQAMAICAGVALRRAATLARTGARNRRLPWPTGE